MTRYVVTLPWPDPVLRSNSRVHWALKARAVKSARHAAFWAAREAKVPCIPDATIFIEYYPKAYREDRQNVPASLKAAIDGIADAMGCDDKGFRVDYPTEWAGKRDPGEVVFRIDGTASGIGATCNWS